MPNTTELAFTFTERELIAALLPFNELAQFILHYAHQTKKLSETFFNEWNAALAYPPKFLTADFLKEVLVAYPVYSAVIVFSLVLGVGLSAVGVFWCFCRMCCGRCGSRLKHGRDARHSEAARRCCGTLLFFSTVIIIIGCAMASMSVYLLSRQLVVVQKHNEDHLDVDADVLAWLAAERAKSSEILKYATWANVLLAQKETKTTTNYDHHFYGAALQIAKEINVVFSKLNVFVKADFLVELHIESTIAALQEAAWTSLGLDPDGKGDTAKWLEQENQYAQSLINCIVTLLSNFNNASADIALSKNYCPSNACTSKMQSYSNDLTSFGSLLANLNASLTYLQHVRHMQQKYFSYEAIASIISNSINDSKIMARQSVSAASGEVSRFSALTQQLSAFTNLTMVLVRSSSFRSIITNGEQYGPYGLWALLGTFAFLALFLMVGLSCGACGSRDTAFEHGGCCRRTRGSKVMIFSVAILFLLVMVFAVTFLCVFLLGAVSQTEVCQSFDSKRHVNNSASSKTLLDETINHYLSPYFSEANYKFDFNEFLGSQGGLLGALFDSKTEIMVRTLTSQYSKNKLVQEFSAALNGWLNTLASAAAEYEELWTNMRKNGSDFTTSVAITSNLTMLTDNTSTITQLFGNQYEREAVALSESFSRLNDSLNAFQRDFLSIRSFDINRTTPTLLLEWMKNYTNRVPYSDTGELLNTTIAAYMNYVKYIAIPCSPLQNAISIFSSTVCNDLLRNMQVLWLGMAFVALVYVPTVLSALRLDILYRRVLPFLALPKDSGGDGTFQRNVLRMEQRRHKASNSRRPSNPCRPSKSNNLSEILSNRYDRHATTNPPTYRPPRFLVRPSGFTNSITMPEGSATGTPFTYLSAGDDNQIALPVLQLLQYNRQSLPPGVTLHETASFRF